jgi:predicted dehydrogenase
VTRSVAALKTLGRIRVGLIGDRQVVSERHIPVLGMLPDYELVGIFDLDQTIGDVQAVPTARTFHSVTELVSDPEIDLVAVVADAPQAYHAICEAITAGKDVYSEWPLDLDGEHLAEAASLAKQAGVRSFIGLHPRVSETSRFILDLVSQGFLGTLRSVHLYADLGSWARPGLHVSRSGCSIDAISILAGNYLDALFTVVGKPRHLSGLVTERSDAGEGTGGRTQLCMFGALESGALFSVHIDEGRGRHGGLLVGLAGDKGSLKVNGNTVSSAAGIRCTIEGCQGNEVNDRPLVIPRTYAWHTEGRMPNGTVPLANLYSAFANDLHEGTSRAPTFDDGAWIHRLLQSVTESSASGIRVGPPEVSATFDARSLRQ